MRVANVAASDSDVCLCRLTLAKEFSPAPLFVKASASPHLLPALLLDEHRKHVLQTRGAVGLYPTEVTCLIIIRNSKVETLLAVSMPAGGFWRHPAVDHSCREGICERVLQQGPCAD